MRRADLGRVERGERGAAEADVVVDRGGHHAEPVGERGGVVGLLADDRGQQAGAYDEAGADVDEIGSGGRRRRDLGGDGTSGSSDSTWQIRVAATRARMTLLANSVAVRSGIIRNAE